MKENRVLKPETAAFIRSMTLAGDSVVDVMEIAGVPPLTPEQHEGFEYLHNYLFFPQPPWLKELRTTPAGERWYLRLVGGIFDNVQSARLAVEYHLGNIKAIESAVHTILQDRDLSIIPPNQTVAIGSTQKLEFEYHAYVFAYRRTLEYLARAMAGYLKCDCSSFNRFSKVLRAKRSSNVATRLQVVCDEFDDQFAFVVSDGNEGVSVRDRISHYEFTSAGSYNLTRDGFRLIGGGEVLHLSGKAATLSEALLERLQKLDAFLSKMLHEFTDALREENSDASLPNPPAA
jgi:hypothetical protein